MKVFIFIKSHELEKKNISILERGLFFIMYNRKYSAFIYFPKKLTSSCPIITFWKISQNNVFHKYEYILFLPGVLSWYF